MRIVHKLIKWAIFSVAVALMPLAFHAIQLAWRGNPFSIGAIIGHGELLLVSVAIAAAAIGDLQGNKHSTLGTVKLLSTGFCFIVLLMSSLFYADISACQLADQVLQESMIKNVSLLCYAVTLVCGGCCVALAEVA